MIIKKNYDLKKREKWIPSSDSKEWGDFNYPKGKPYHVITNMTQKVLPDNLKVNVLEWEEKNSREPIYWKFPSFF